MTTEQKEKLILVFTTAQMLIFEIDELREDAKICFHKVKKYSTLLCEEIEKVHGKNIQSVWNIEGGEETMTALLKIYNVLFQEIASTKIDACTDLIPLIKAFKAGEVQTI